MAKKFTTLLLLTIILLPGLAIAHQGHNDPSAQSTPTQQPINPNIQATVYYNEACGMCSTYVQKELPDRLKKHGIENLILKDYINQKEYRQEMNQLINKYKIPFDLQSHIMTFIGEKYILGGHIPQNIIDDIFKKDNNNKFKQIIIYQDEMSDNVENYKIWAIPNYASSYIGPIQLYSIDQLPTNYLDSLQQNKDNLLKETTVSNEDKSILPLILISGFLDGFNPCAFAVLIFFIAFLFTLQRSIGHIFKLGLIYISVIYLTYLGIGFGLFNAIIITGQPHLMAKIGAWLVIVLGLINIKDYIFPNLPFHLRIPKFSTNTLKHWLTKATVPAVIIAAFLVGLCTFPCSGGIYVAIIGLLANRGTFLEGMGYMLIYNLMFILPLLVLLVLAGNKYSLSKVAKWQSTSDKKLKLWSGIIMIAIGLIILTWFI